MRRVSTFASGEYIWVRLGERPFASEGVLYEGRDDLLNLFVAISIPFLFRRLALQNSASWFLVRWRVLGGRGILWLRLVPIVFPFLAASAFESGQKHIARPEVAFCIQQGPSTKID